MNAVYSRYASKPTKPRLHPVAQLFGGEWVDSQSSGRSISWAGLTVNAITQACEQQRANPRMEDWHPHLSASDLSSYLDEVAPKYLWWRHPVPPAAEPAEDGACYWSFIHSLI